VAEAGAPCAESAASLLPPPPPLAGAAPRARCTSAPVLRSRVRVSTFPAEARPLAPPPGRGGGCKGPKTGLDRWDDGHRLPLVKPPIHLSLCAEIHTWCPLVKVEGGGAGGQCRRRAGGRGRRRATRPSLAPRRTGRAPRRPGPTPGDRPPLRPVAAGGAPPPHQGGPVGISGGRCCARGEGVHTIGASLDGATGLVRDPGRVLWKGLEGRTPPPPEAAAAVGAPHALRPGASPLRARG